MKFLKYRDDFINEKSELTSQFKSSNLVKEYLENELKFGDSLFGRLVNSSVQMLNTAFKTIRIPFILKSLENQLQVMVDRIALEQITKEYPTLFLKSTLEQIKSCCVSTLDDDQKLEILIGWDGSFTTYDPTNPISDIPGYYENRKIVRPSLIQDQYNKLSEKQIREKLEKAFNPTIIKTYLDTLSDFMDELRKFAYELSHTGSPVVSTPPKPFNLNLLGVLKDLVKINLNESLFDFKFLSYSRFVNENQDGSKNLDNLEKLQNIAKNLTSDVEQKTEEEVKNSSEYKQFIEILKKLTPAEIEVLKDNDLLKSIQNTTDVKIQGPIQSNIEKSDIVTPAKQTTTQPLVSQKPTVMKPKEETPVQKSLPLKEEPTDVAQEKPEEQEDQNKPEEKTSEKFNSKYSNYISLVLESTGTPAAPTGATTTGATTTGTTTTGATTTGTPAAPTVTPEPPKNVEEIWKKFFDEVDKILPAKMTQDDIEKLNSFTPDKIDLAYSITKKPDPLIKVVRLFETANSIYTTPQIPSGREDGRVWPMTFRRYTYVGTGTPGVSKSPGYGPWVHNDLFKQWKRGVMGIMGKPEFKDIFKDIKGLVENYNLDSDRFEKIYEQEKPTEKSSTSKILQEFILDILKLKNQGDFDTYVSKAMNRFFGISVDPTKLVGSKGSPVQEIPIDKNDIQVNTFIWESFKQTKFTSSDENKLFAFPIEDLRVGASSRHSIIFLHPIKVNNDKVEVKFTYDSQTEANTMVNSIGGRDAKKADWSSDGTRTRYVYYGVMKNDFSNGIQMCYSNVAESNDLSFKADPLYGEPRSKGGVIFKLNRDKIKLNDGKYTNLFNAKLVYYDKDKKKQEVTVGRNLGINGEKSDDDLKNLPTSGGKLYDELIKKGKDKYGWS